MKKHVKDVHSDSHEYKCTNCDYTTKNERYLKGHIKRGTCNNNPGEWHSCDICIYKTKVEIALKYHKDRVHKSSKWTRKHCNQCDKTLCDDKSLKQHLEIHMAKADRPTYNCDIIECESKFNYISSLKFHKKVHQKRMMMMAKSEDVIQKEEQKPKGLMFDFLIK